MKNNLFFAIGLLFFLAVSCSSDYTPKPRAYLRIDLPLKSYQELQNDALPYSFEFPDYAEVIPVPPTEDPDSKYWVNIEFPSLNGTLHLAYNSLDSIQELYAHIDSSYQAMFFIHKDKVTGINERTYEDPEQHVYGVLYELKGSRVASPYQFYVTDKKGHFIRGALYFHMQPNNDSLAPVINYVKEDIEHMMSTMRWYDNQEDLFQEFNKKGFIN